MPEYSGFVELADARKIRLDRYIAQYTALLSRSQLKARNGAAWVNGKAVKFSFPVRSGDKIELNWDDEPPVDLIAEDIPLKIIYEDARVIVVNKPQGMVVHPAAGNWSGTLANALLGHLYKGGSLPLAPQSVPACSASPSPRGSAPKTPPVLRPFIVHRLDKDTSGVIIAAWDDEALVFLQEQFKARTTRKTYIALTQGIPAEAQGIISTGLCRDKNNRKRFAVSDTTGKIAITRYRVIAGYRPAGGAKYALLLLRPKTGRTHQLRVHLKALGCPILGDPLYGIRDKDFPHTTLMLHARRLSVMLPQNHEPSTFTAPVPRRFLHCRNKLSGLMEK